MILIQVRIYEAMTEDRDEAIDKIEENSARLVEVTYYDEDEWDGGTIGCDWPASGCKS